MPATPKDQRIVYVTDATADVKDIEIFEVPTIADNLTTVADSISEWVTSSEAASRLKKSERTIQRYVKKGKLYAKTDESGRLLIGLTTSADNPPTYADTDANLATSVVSEQFWSLLHEKDAKVEALIMRNGYLQAQLEASQQTIKLLTDSQHKSKWWQRFGSWFK